MTLLLYSLTFCLAVARPELGLMVLTFALASVGTAWGYTSIPGLGGLQLSDFALLGITFNLICHPASWTKRKYVIWLLIVLWIFGAAVVHASSRAGGVNIAYDLVIRYALLWFIPIIVAELTPARRHTVLVGMLVCGALITGVQLYTYVKRDPSFTVQMYYQFQDRRFCPSPQRCVQDAFDQNRLPRLYPSGAVLVQSLLVFLLVSHVLPRHTKWSNGLTATLLCLYGVFFMSLQQRSAAISLVVALCLFLSWQSGRHRRLHTVVRAVGIGMAAIIGVLVCQATMGVNFVDDFERRFQNEQILEQHNRVADIDLALRAISRSPLLGTASSNLPNLAVEEGRNTLGEDVNPFLSIGLMGGLPLLFLVLAAACRIARLSSLIMIRAADDSEAVGGVISIVYMFCLAALNTSQVFTSPKDMLPMLLFVGIIQGCSCVQRTGGRVARRRLRLHIDGGRDNAASGHDTGVYV